MTCVGEIRLFSDSNYRHDTVNSPCDTLVINTRTTFYCVITSLNASFQCDFPSHHDQADSHMRVNAHSSMQ